jgi:hypothetical protein
MTRYNDGNRLTPKFIAEYCSKAAHYMTILIDSIKKYSKELVQCIKATYD